MVRAGRARSRRRMGSGRRGPGEADGNHSGGSKAGGGGRDRGQAKPPAAAFPLLDPWRRAPRWHAVLAHTGESCRPLSGGTLSFLSATYERRAGGAPASTVAASPQPPAARLRAHHAGLRYEIAGARSYRFHTGPAANQPAAPMWPAPAWTSLRGQEPTLRSVQMSEPHVAERRRSRPASASRFARILRLLRWPVVIVWLVAVVALYPAAHTLSNLANGTAAANLPSSAPSTRVVELQQGPGQPDIDAATVVFVRDTGLTAADLAAIASAHAAVAHLARHVHRLGVPGPPQRSADGKADEFTADVTSPSGGNSEFDNDSKAVQAIRHAVGALARGGLQ